MTFDFETVLEREGWDSLAVEAKALPGGLHLPPMKEGFDKIPMWIADMSFQTAPSVQAAMQRRLDHGIYGYFGLPPIYYDKIIRWQQQQYGVNTLTDACIGYENSVLGGLMSAMRAVCPPGGPVLLHAPTYSGFLGSLKKAGYDLIISDLYEDKNGTWRMDYADMEEKIKKYSIHTVVFCSPHNPTGRVWTESELAHAMALFEKYEVTVISDEIWADLVLWGGKHIPTQTISDYAKAQTIALYAPTKTFNLAGLVGSYHVIYNNALRDRVQREGALGHYNSMNVMSLHALLGAYSEEGAAWRRELITVIEENVSHTLHFLETELPLLRARRPEGTYVLFVDCSAYLNRHGLREEDVLLRAYEVGVLCQDGRAFGWPQSIRLNLALPRQRLEEALFRLREFVFC